MRFKWFRSKGSLDTRLDKQKDKKKTAKNDNNASVICTGYRINTEFDHESRTRFTNVTTQPNPNNQASSSHSHFITNGSVPGTIVITDHPKETVVQPRKNDSGDPGVTISPTTDSDFRLHQAPNGSGRNEVATNLYENTPQIVEIASKSVAQQNNAHEHEETDEHQISVIASRTLAPLPNSDSSEKKSTLIFMTEDHDERRYSGDDDDDDDDDDDNDDDGEEYYEELDDNRQYSPTNTKEERYRYEYSHQAASIFFSGSDGEPDQRKRYVKYKDDDDDAGSQTSA